jgi:hypothetical protein
MQVEEVAILRLPLLVVIVTKVVLAVALIVLIARLVGSSIVMLLPSVMLRLLVVEIAMVPVVETDTEVEIVLAGAIWEGIDTVGQIVMVVPVVLAGVIAEEVEITFQMVT